MNPNDIIVGNRLRALNAERVADLEHSIAAIGLQTPITIRYATGYLDGKPTLIAGAHRLQAVKNLGWSAIPVSVFEGDERAARMWEISENLHRAELTALERSEQTAEWIRLAAQSPGQVDPVKSRREDGRGGSIGEGINAASRELGIDQTAAKRAVRIDSLSDEAKATAVELGLDDNQSALLQAAKAKTAEAQVEALKQRKERKRSAEEPAPKAPASTAKPPAPPAKSASLRRDEWVAEFDRQLARDLDGTLEAVGKMIGGHRGKIKALSAVRRAQLLHPIMQAIRDRDFPIGQLKTLLEDIDIPPRRIPHEHCLVPEPPPLTNTVAAATANNAAIKTAVAPELGAAA